MIQAGEGAFGLQILRGEEEEEEKALPVTLQQDGAEAHQPSQASAVPTVALPPARVAHPAASAAI